MMKHLLYSVYYLKNTSIGELVKLLRYAKKEKASSAFLLLKDMLISSFRYKISFLDYFSFRFFELGPQHRSEYMGAGAMYEYQLKMNPKKYRRVLADKIAFLQKFNGLSGREWATLEMLQRDHSCADVFLRDSVGKVVLKNALGQAGKEVEVCKTATLNREQLVAIMRKKRFNLVEAYVIQHDLLMRLSPAAVNTIRLITQIHKGEVIIVAARLRISIHSVIDNVSSGNIIAPVDIHTGRINGPGIYADITKPDEYVHPVTGVALIGFQIPMWRECIQLVTQAAGSIPENRSVGWDVAITSTRPVLIEGNHNWHYLSLQMPVRKGFKQELLKYLV